VKSSLPLMRHQTLQVSLRSQVITPYLADRAAKGERDPMRQHYIAYSDDSGKTFGWR